MDIVLVVLVRTGMYRPVPLCDISQVVRTGTYYIIVQVGTGRYVPVRTDMSRDQVYRIPDVVIPVPRLATTTKQFITNESEGQ